MNKVFPSAEMAIKDIPDGAVIMAGGFGLCGIPENLIRALRAQGTKDLTIISNNCGTEDKGLGILLANNQVRKMFSSYVGENKIFERQFLEGDIEVELIPQGTFAEKIRAGGAGIPAFYTPTGYGTQVSEGTLPLRYSREGKVIKVSDNKETRQFDGRWYVLENSLRAQFALVKAWKGDRFGNLVYRKTACNFNPMMASAADITIAEVEEMVEPGELDPDHIHTPGIYVERIICGEWYEKPIERRTVRPRETAT